MLVVKLCGEIKSGKISNFLCSCYHTQFMSHNSLQEIMLWWTFVWLRWATYFCVWIHSVIILQVRNTKMIQSWKFAWHVQPLWPTIWLNRMITIVVAMYVLVANMVVMWLPPPYVYHSNCNFWQGDYHLFLVVIMVCMWWLFVVQGEVLFGNVVWIGVAYEGHPW